MQSFKGFFVAILGLLLVVTLFSLLMPSKVMTVRSVTIHGTADEVFKQVNDLEQWKHWHPVFMHDSSVLVFSKPSTGVHAFAEWTSNDRKNRLLLTEVMPNRLKATLSRKGENDTDYIISVLSMNDGNNVQAEWRVVTNLKWYPWEKFSGIFVDNMTGPGYETALNNLKAYIEGRE